MRSRLTSLVLVVLAVCLALVCAELENTSVLRTVDLSSQLLRDSIQVAITNVGSTPVSEYVVSIENPEEVAFLQVKTKKPSTVLPHKLSKDGKSATITLEPALQAGDKANIVISIVRSHVFKPFPKEVAQNDKQQFKYEGNPLFYSEYPTLKTRTSFIFPSEEVTYTGEGLSLTANKVTFGPYSTKVAPLSSKQAEFHYTNNARFLTTEKLVRTIEVSHWGNNLAYEEFYDVVHDGAKLKGHYSRLDYDRSSYNHQNTAVIKKIDLTFPVGATDAYYRDIIGNISTSNFRSTPFESVLELVPRYPLYGGWKTKWYHGYNLPLSSALQKAADGSFILNFLFVAPYEEAVIDDFTLLVTLPEGATDIQFHSEFDLGVQQSFEVVKTYLDSYGRPVVKITRRNVVNDHRVPVQITYKYPSYLLLQEPLLLTGFFLVLFLSSIFFVRLDLSIAKDPKAEKKERTRGHWLDIIEQEEAKKEIAEKLNDALELFKNDKNVEAYDARKKVLERDLKVANEAVNASQAALKNIDPPLAAKVDEIKAFGEDKWKHIFKAHAEFIASKGAKKSILDELAKEVNSSDKKIENVLSSPGY